MTTSNSTKVKPFRLIIRIPSVARVRSESLDLARCTRSVFARTNQSVSTSGHLQCGILIIGEHTRFINFSRQGSDAAGHTGAGIMLERSETSIARSGRRDWRVPIDFPVSLRPLSTKKKLKGRLLDLTEKGAIVETSTPFEAGEILDVIFQLPKSAMHEVVAQVMYCDDAPPDETCRLGLRFVDVKKQARDAITWFLYERVQELYSDELRELYPPSTSSARGSCGPETQYAPAR